VRLLRLALALLAALAVPAMTAAAPPPADHLLKWPDLLERPRPEPDATVHYGPGALQVVDVWLPKRKGRKLHPVVLMVHGGCWQSDIADRRIMNWIADDLRKRGVAVWNIDYRGVDREGGGYPGTFADAAAAADALTEHAGEYRLDAEKVVALGHSAGGHLALWLASRVDRDASPVEIHVAFAGATTDRLENDAVAPLQAKLSPLPFVHDIESLIDGDSARTTIRLKSGADPEAAVAAVREALRSMRGNLPADPELTVVGNGIPAASPMRGDGRLWIRAVVASGALPDLRQAASPPASGCGTEVVDSLVGKPTGGRPDVYADTSPAEAPHIRARQFLVNGENDRIIPAAYPTAYRERRRERAELVEVDVVPHTGHVELIAPESEAWRRQISIIEKIFSEKPIKVKLRVVQPR
jgi:acetyl esterase/lipase